MPRSVFFITRRLPHVLLACRRRADLSSQSRHECANSHGKTGTGIDDCEDEVAKERLEEQATRILARSVFFSADIDAGMQRLMI